MPHLTTLMNTIWAFTVLANISLAFILIERNLYIRYSWLTISAILSVILDAFFAYLRFTQFHAHFSYRSAIFLFFIFVNAMIVLEAWNVKDKVVWKMVSAQTVLELCALAIHKLGGVWVAYYMDCTTRFTNLLILMLFLLIFSERRGYERTAN